MKFGFILPNYGDRIGPAELVEISKACEEEGFDSVWATDHVIVPVELKEPYGTLIEPLITISFVAAATEKLKVGTSSVVLPQRNPILLAKQAAAIDAFSGGRVILGLGVGWAEKEFAYLGADFKQRGRVMEESIALMRRLWSDDVVNFQGRFFSVKDALFFPKPVNRGIPVWIAGNSERALDRAIRLGDGWHPVGSDLKGYASGVKRIRDSGKRLTLSLRIPVDLRKKREDTVGPSGDRRTYFSGSPADVRRSIEEYAGAGLEYPCISILHPSAKDVIADVRVFGRDVIGSYG